MQAGTYEKRDVVKVIVETTAYAKALVKLEEKSPDTNYWIGAGTFVVNINGVRTYTLSSTRCIAKIEGDRGYHCGIGRRDGRLQNRVARDTSIWRRLPSIRILSYLLFLRWRRSHYNIPLSGDPRLHRELMWYATEDNAVLGVVILDLVDKDYSWVVLTENDQGPGYTAIDMGHHFLPRTTRQQRCTTQ